MCRLLTGFYLVSRGLWFRSQKTKTLPRSPPPTNKTIFQLQSGSDFSVGRRVYRVWSFLVVYFNPVIGVSLCFQSGSVFLSEFLSQRIGQVMTVRSRLSRGNAHTHHPVPSPPDRTRGILDKCFTVIVGWGRTVYLVGFYRGLLWFTGDLLCLVRGTGVTLVTRSCIYPKRNKKIDIAEDVCKQKSVEPSLLGFVHKNKNVDKMSSPLSTCLQGTKRGMGSSSVVSHDASGVGHRVVPLWLYWTFVEPK